MTTETIDVVPEEAVVVDSSAQLAKAEEVIRHNMLWSAGAGILPVPGFDLVAITAVQLKLVSELCAAYNLPFNKSLAKPIILSLISSLGAGWLAPIVASTTVKLVPGIGALLSGTFLSATSSAITYGVGQLFLDHFKNGGDLSNFNLIAGRGIFKRKVQEAPKVETASEGATTAV